MFNFYRNVNIYEACVPDRMHHIDLGLFKYQLEYMQEILKDVGGMALQKSLMIDFVKFLAFLVLNS